MSIDNTYSGRYPWGKSVELWEDELDGLYEWLNAYGVADHIAKKLYEKKFLTEGEFAELLGFKSKLDQADLFFCGDKDKYEKAMKINMEEILLVTTRNCPKCKEAMRKLDAAGVYYKLAAAEENTDYIEKLGIQEAPTIIVRPEDEYEKYTKIYSGLGGVYTFLKESAK